MTGWDEWTNDKTTNQSNKQTIKQSNKQTINQSNKQTNKQTNDLSILSSDSIGYQDGSHYLRCLGRPLNSSPNPNRLETLWGQISTTI
jgi:hypothetical protein